MSSSTTAAHWSTTDARPRVLVGVDGSADGLRAVRYGAGIAKARGQLLHLVHAVDDAVLAGAWGVVYDPGALQQAGEEAIEEAVAAARAEGLADDQVHGEVVLGNGAGVLTRLSEGAELLVVGRRSVSGLERMFIGSTSVAVAGGAKCPVVVISQASTPQATGTRARIAVAIDAMEHSAATLGWALGEAERRGVALTVVHAIVPQVTGPSVQETQAAATRGIEELLAPLRSAHPGVPVEIEVASASPVDELVGVTAEVDLLVMGLQRSRFLGVHLGGLMRGVLAHAACPVVLVK